MTRCKYQSFSEHPTCTTLTHSHTNKYTRNCILFWRLTYHPMMVSFLRKDVNIGENNVWDSVETCHGGDS